MKTPPTRPNGRRSRVEASGQALLEFAMVVFVLVILAFGLIDFSRFINAQQVVVNVTREAANLASRGTNMTDALTAVINSAQPLNVNTSGLVIITSVTNNNGAIRIASQVSQGGITAASRVGTVVGNLAVLPATAVAIPQPTQTLYICEMFYTFTPITPVGALLGLVLPTRIYDVAYF
jgi:Flp pilus assembly protein TadG